MSKIDFTSIIPSYEEMLKAGVHYGRKKTVRHPRMEPFIYALRDTIHLIDVLKTEEKLKKAMEFLKDTKDSGGTILWVGTTKQSEEKILEVASKFNSPYIIGHWLGGILTNFKTIQARVKYLVDLETKKNSPEKMEGMSKKERVMMDKEITKLKTKIEGLKLMNRLPDVVFVGSLREGMLPIKEAKILGIKTVAIVNTESDPTLVDYPIPANDNAKSSVEMILDIIKKGIE